MPAPAHRLSKTTEYYSWNAMMQRCYNPNHRSFPRYGGRGIHVTKRWHKFENFFADAGHKPFDGAQLDRIDSNRGYMKTNCRWATAKENQNNRSSNRLVLWLGVQYTVAQWCEFLSLDRGLVYNRLRRGWSLEQIATIPARGMHGD